MPDVDEDGSALGDAMAIINVVLGGGVGDRLRGDGTPAVDLLGSFQSCRYPVVFREWLYLVPKRLRILQAGYIGCLGRCASRHIKHLVPDSLLKFWVFCQDHQHDREHR